MKLNDSYDVLIVGGGINGVGIARDLALRGVSCLLIEKGDFSAGTSGASSGMIHGGVRYLLNDRSVTKLSCLDSGYIQKIAPHLLFRIPFLYTVYEEAGKSKAKSKILLDAVDAFFGTYDAFVPLKNGQPHTRVSPQEIVELEPNIPAQGLLGGVTFDEWGIDVPRLCIANVVDAIEHGAHAANHTEVVSAIRDGDRLTGLALRDTLTGETQKVSGKMIVNATGPWSPHFAKILGVDLKVRGGKGIHITFDRRLFNMAVVAKAIDGREIFLMPYENVTILGTTDDDYFGDLDDQKCLDDELEYLLDGIEQIFPAVRQARMIRSWSGVRPTLYARGVSEDDLSREHEVVDHETKDSLKGAISLLGGKLASYRILAQEATDLICQKLGVDKACETHLKTLPGGDMLPDITETAEKYGLDPFVVSRLIYRHGSRALRILDDIKAEPKLAARVCSCEPVTEAEIRYVIKHEMARTLSDIRRRTRMSLGPCQATNCLIGSSSVLAEGLGQGAEDSVDRLQEFFNEWWWNKACVLNATQLKQEELNQALHFCNNSLDL